MSKSFAALVSALVLAVFVAPASAQMSLRDIERGKVTIEPDRGYIYVESVGRSFGVFLRVHDEQDYADHIAEAQARFVEAQEKYQRDYASWERRAEEARKRRWNVPDAPEVPTEEDYAPGPIDLRDVVSFGPTYQFSEDKDTDRRAYLTALKPGTYIWYGPIMFDPNQGYVGACYCMGTVQFEVPAGVVTDLGDFLTTGPRFEDRQGAQAEELLNFRIIGLLGSSRVSMFDPSLETHYGLPEILAPFAGPPVEFQAVGKINNHYGILVDRLPPVDGVLSYRRDVVVDEISGEEIVSVPQVNVVVGE